MQAAQHAALGLGMVVLDETARDSRRGVEGGSIEALVEETACVTDCLGFAAPHIGPVGSDTPHAASPATSPGYWPAPVLPRASGRRSSCWRSIPPFWEAISSRRPTFRPWRCSMVCTYC